MKKMLRSGSVLCVLLLSLSGCTLQNTLLTTSILTSPNSQITQRQHQKQVHHIWKTRLKKLKKGEKIPAWNPVCSQSPFQLVKLQNIDLSDSLCWAVHPPLLPQNTESSLEPKIPEFETLRTSMVAFAKNYLGLRYRSAGKSPQTGFDCSGFTHFVMKNFGIAISPSSRKQATEGQKISLAEARKGDLLFFGYRSKSGTWRVNHAALVVSEKGQDLAMIHSCRRGIVIDDVNSASWRSYYAKRLLFATRVLNSSIQNTENEGISSTESISDNLNNSQNF